MNHLTYEILNAYFKYLARKHRLINDFTGFTFHEFKEKTSGPGLKYPALVMEGYRGKLDGNTQRTFNEREITFSIVIQTTSKVDDVERAQALAEQIGLSILSRINDESLKNANNWLYRNFLPETVTYSEIDFSNKDRITGLKFGFNLKTHQPFEMNKRDWKDKSSLAFSTGFTIGFR